MPRAWSLPVLLAGALAAVLCGAPPAAREAPATVVDLDPPGERVPERPESEVLAGAGERITLPGTGWRQTSGPTPQPAPWTEQGDTCFRPLQAGFYLFESTGADGAVRRRGVRVPAGHDPWIGDRRPAAVLPRTVGGRTGERILLDGSLSNAPDVADDALAGDWNCPDAGRGIELQPEPGLKASFTAAREGVYRVLLIVSDGKLDSAPAEVLVDVRPADAVAPPALPDPNAPPAQDLLERPVTLGLRERNLDWAVRLFPVRCGLVLRVDPAFAPPSQLPKIPLWVGVRQAPARLLLDWMARQTTSAYRRDTDQSVWLVPPARWIQEEKLIPVAAPVDALYQAPDGSDLERVLTAPFRSLTAARRGATLAVQAQMGVVVGALPAAGVRRLQEMVACLRAPKEPGLSLPPDPTPEEAALRALLARKTLQAAWDGKRLDYLLQDFGEASGLAVGFDPRQFPKGLPHVTLRCDGVPLREAVRELVAAAGFDGCQPAPGGGLWFYRGAEPYPSGELLWDIAVVRAYEVAPLLTRLPVPSGEVLVHQVRQRIFPGSWDELGVGCSYHALTGRLLVVHGPAAQARVLSFLHDIGQRGEAALRPRN